MTWYAPPVREPRDVGDVVLVRKGDDLEVVRARMLPLHAFKGEALRWHSVGYMNKVTRWTEVPDEE